VVEFCELGIWPSHFCISCIRQDVQVAVASTQYEVIHNFHQCLNNYISSVAISRLLTVTYMCVCVWWHKTVQNFSTKFSLIYSSCTNRHNATEIEYEGINWIRLAQDEGQQQALRHK